MAALIIESQKTIKKSSSSLIYSKKIKKHFYIKNLSAEKNFQFVNLLKYGSTNKTNNSIKDFNNFHDNGNSGANACSVGICLGYERIILLGVDCNYVEFVDGSKKDGPGGLVMEKTPEKNPNYWFDDYQQKGDEYNIPDGFSFHMPTWNMLAYRAARANIQIVKLQPINYFKMLQKNFFKRGSE